MPSIAAAQAPATPPGPAPAPGSPATFKSAADIAAVLQKANAGATGTSSSPVTTNEHYRVSVLTRSKPAGALAHPGNTELLHHRRFRHHHYRWHAGAGRGRQAGVNRQRRRAALYQGRRVDRAGRLAALVFDD